MFLQLPVNLNLWFLTEEHTCVNTNALKIKGPENKPHLKSTLYNCITGKRNHTFFSVLASMYWIIA